MAGTRGENRAIAGGGRYDQLIEMFGGPTLPAVGFGMGDVVLAILLQERGKLPADAGKFSPDVFVVNALTSADEAMRMAGILRREKISVGTSYKATKNFGKLLQEASASGAKVAVILAPAEWERGLVKVKTLSSRTERDIPASEVINAVRSALVLDGQS